jgi:hypothetical protein
MATEILDPIYAYGIQCTVQSLCVVENMEVECVTKKSIEEHD